MGEIAVEVCFAQAGAIFLKALRLPRGSTVQAAIEASGVLNEVPGIDLVQCRVGIYGKQKTLDTVLRERDRVELYRPLVADPKDARRRRAAVKARG